MGATAMSGRTGAKTAVLHIGTPKTGSTSIQESLFRAEMNGSLGTLRYPLWRSDRNHERLAALYRPHRELPGWWHQRYPADDRAFQRMRRQFSRFLFGQLNSASRAVISWEGLFGLAPELVRRFQSDLEASGFGDCHVVLYIRDPAQMYLTGIQQQLKTATWIQPFVRDPEAFRYPVLQAVQTWEHVFPGRVMVRRFPPVRDVVEDFAAVVKRHTGVSLPRLPVRVNTTLSAEAMQILQDYRQSFWPDSGGILTPDTRRLVSFLRDSEHAVQQTPPVLKAEIADRIRANHRADAQAIFDCYGVELFPLQAVPREDSARVRTPTRIDEIVESVDAEVVHQILLRLARTELGRRPHQRRRPARLAAGAYQPCAVGRHTGSERRAGQLRRGRA